MALSGLAANDPKYLFSATIDDEAGALINESNLAAISEDKSGPWSVAPANNRPGVVVPPPAFLEGGKPNPAFWRDYDVHGEDHFIAMLDHDELPGSDDLLLDVSIDPGAPARGQSAVSWTGHKSRLWEGKAHDQRLQETQLLCHQYCRASREELDARPDSAVRSRCLPMLPWEMCCYSLEFTQQTEGARDDVTRGLLLPKLDLPEWEFRLLILAPHRGDPDSPIETALIVSYLRLHSCFVVVRNGRGFPSIREKIIVNGKTVEISKNLEAFLRQIRRPNVPLALYIRELCLNRYDQDERSVRYNPRFQSLVENCSCGIIELNRVMEDLLTAGLLVREGQNQHEKRWNEETKHSEFPWHFPVHLRIRSWPPYNTMLTQEQVEQLPSYTYVPLDLVTEEIRVLSLYPARSGSFQEPLMAELAHIPLHGNFTFLALSYTWGSPERTKTMRIAKDSLQITENLDVALRHLRAHQTTNQTIIWIDAICINQDDVREKNLHVPRMQAIYERATGVFIWLGRAISLDTVNFIEEIRNGAPHMLDENGNFKESTELAQQWANLYDLFKTPFFSRKWIVQEIASASVPTVLLDGRGSHPLVRMQAWSRVQLSAWLMARIFERIFGMWVEYCKGSIVLEHQELEQMVRGGFEGDADAWNAGLHDVKAQLEQISHLTYVRELRENDRSPSFLLLALLAQNAQCQDPRDRIFSIWSICRESKSIDIKADYSTSIESSYTSFVQTFARHRGRLDIICVSQYPTAANVTPTIPYSADLELPSWCPDWRQSRKTSSLLRELIPYGDHERWARLDIDVIRYHCDALELEHRNPARPTPFHFEERTLLACGVVMDTVKFVSKFPEHYRPQPRPPTPWFGEILEQCLDKDATDDVRKQLMSDALSMFIGQPPGTVEGWWEETEDGWEVTRKEIGTPDIYVSDNSRQEHMIMGRRLIVTENGYMGLAPWHVRGGFKIAILLGCSVPVLLEWIDEATADGLRESFFEGANGDKATHNAPFRDVVAGWYFRGDVFVQGWMQGQMIRKYGETTEEAWEQIGLMDQICIN